MFSQLFFIFLALTLINLTAQTDLTYWIQDPLQAFQWSLFGFSLLLLAIVCQAKIFHLFKKRIQSFWGSVINVEALIYLAIYHFGLGAQRFILKEPLEFFQAPFALVSLFLYFIILGWAHFWHAYFQMHHSFKKALKGAYSQVLFYCPFCLPFIIMSILFDGLENFFSWEVIPFAVNRDLIAYPLSLVFLILIFLFLPALMVFCWRCKSIDRPDLKERLESLCHTLHFRHGGLKIWSMIPHAYTAGIIGIIPAFRYILFTPALLKRFQPQEVEAILTHEIGHHRHKHLLFYPFILLGMVVFGTLFLIAFESILYLFWEKETSSDSADFIAMISIFLFYASWMGIYFRLVFGFFSRLFERQADLHIFASPLPPDSLIQALDHLGVVTGYTHDHPNWHHFSLRERIRFLYQAIENPHLIPLHHKKVKKWLCFYFMGLVMGCFSLYWIIF